MKKTLSILTLLVLTSVAFGQLPFDETPPEVVPPNCYALIEHLVPRIDTRATDCWAGFQWFFVKERWNVGFSDDGQDPRLVEQKIVEANSSCQVLSDPYVLEETGCMLWPLNQRFVKETIYYYDHYAQRYTGMNAQWHGCYGLCRAGGTDTPILIPLTSNGVANALSSVADGVSYDVGNRSLPVQTSWLNGAGDVGWLYWDMDRNGNLPNGRYLFGNASPQDPDARFIGETRNGFRALRGHDRNFDGIINAEDKNIWPELGVWTDDNRNGFAEANERHGLESLGVTGISVTYEESRRQDRYKNEYRFKGLMTLADGSTRVIWDVILQSQQG